MLVVNMPSVLSYKSYISMICNPIVYYVRIVKSNEIYYLV